MSCSVKSICGLCNIFGELTLFAGVICGKWSLSLLSRLQSIAAASREKAEVEAAMGAAEGQTGRLTQEFERLRKRAQELENEVAKLNRIIDEAKLQESKLGDRVGRLVVRRRGIGGGGTAFMYQKMNPWYV